MTHSSPSATARVRTPPARSLPAPGSVRASAPRPRSPDAKSGSQWALSASDPYTAIGAQARPLCAETRQRRGAAGPAQLFDGDGGADGVAAGAAVGLRDVQSQQAQRAHFALGRPVELGVRVRFTGARLKLVAREVVDGFAPHFLFVAQVQSP